ncbi:hypothetical protein [Natronorubrum halophilum]|uniref:hypothetical protein n=1 Tax=Natronorubrum halophilum TaxID=1702106 RepID=UPI0010C21C68|nr:hypothetical protein [Natronorubrum halophilum]
MNTDTNDTNNANGSNSTNDARIPRDAAKLEHDARRAAREDIAQRFDEAEKEARHDRRDRPVGPLTPTGRYTINGDGDDAWLTSSWAVNEEGAR